MMDEETRKSVRTRLRRIGGQVEGIGRMVDEERYCVDVLLQVAAVKSALDRVGQIVLGAHADTCVTHAVASGDPDDARRKVDELMEVFNRFGGIRGR